MTAKSLGVKIDGNLRWKPYIDYLSCKYRANVLLFKITLYEELYISLYLNYILIIADLYGLRIVMQLMVLPFYKNILSTPLTFSHVTLALLFNSKSFILKFLHNLI